METITQVQKEQVTGRPGSAAKLIREVRAKTRRKFSAEDKVRIVLEEFRKEMPISHLCRREGISSALYYFWLKDFMEAGIEGLKKVRSERRIWNRLSAGEVQKVLEIARLHPEL